MTTTNVLLHFMMYSLMWLLSSRTIIAPSPAGILDLVHDSSSGIAETHDAGAVKSTIEISGERLPHSQPCRRNLEGCGSFLDRKSPIARTSASSGAGQSLKPNEYSVLRTLEPSKSWKVSIVLKMRRIEGKLLFGFFPKLRDNWNIAHANYEEVLAEVMRSQNWGDGGVVATTLADMKTARQRSTSIIGLSPEVRRHISKTALPKLYQNLGSALDQILDHLIASNRGGVDVEAKIFILDKLFKAELQDPELLPYLKLSKEKLDSLYKKYPPKPSTEKPQSLINTNIPPRPSFSDLNKLRQLTPKLESGHIWGWMNCKIDFLMIKNNKELKHFFGGEIQLPDQFLAEQKILEHMRNLKTPVIDEWSPIEKLTREFKESTQQSAWFDQEFHPEKFKVSDYKTLEEIDLQRRALIKAAYRRTKAGFYPPGTDKGEVDFLRNIQFETLTIEGVSDHSEEVVHLLKGSIEHGSEKAKAYLDLLEAIRSPDSAIAQKTWDSRLLSLRRTPPVPKKPAAASNPAVSSAQTIS
ncbi:uncharacterized protein MELLADRAFT_79041 [Melampsora larici-populina 98AG31]|uniref:Secreted protein n=1 Tax=Melampsora larici-populina (strain 98AG31 / pathotype 3-4-7) TaxID=747676 RepID=F4S1Y9_MELLP|nr:uncharacterized protein MELLADRAFT_79041 [Melampsora larici-populina 98AG31]EGG01274.1 hypothetical protein MELLADRAFT_79041 [Melampsora larici-populina 98AG31]